MVWEHQAVFMLPNMHWKQLWTIVCLGQKKGSSGYQRGQDFSGLSLPSCHRYPSSPGTLGTRSMKVNENSFFLAERDEVGTAKKTHVCMVVLSCRTPTPDPWHDIITWHMMVSRDKWQAAFTLTKRTCFPVRLNPWGLFRKVLACHATACVSVGVHANAWVFSS